ncbi:zinc finger protein with KRAB and SCAN domains 3-like [Xenia sp. Carnegie-2017]|uniref:zinc finger protein with KRAB and SCAN domains 3-like n=1 Tax=Xenia sp. Carnegie-2017 TaxID=2897299 RepID=UPI001F0463EC|nr:zinc finger protein with KRAB and SCAN domains 3-like [Xenia sp. Carnegie-2017]
MKVIVCIGETRILVPCDDNEDITVKELCEKAALKYKRMTNKNPDDDIKIAHLKTQPEGAMVDPDDKVSNVAEDKEIFTAVLEEPLQTQLPLINTSNGQVVLALLNNDGSQSTDATVANSQAVSQSFNVSNLSPVFINALMGMLQQSMNQQQPGMVSPTMADFTNTSHASQLSQPTQVNNVDDMLDDEGEDESDNKDGEKKDFPCDQCPKKFKTAWRLRQHLIAHARREEMKKYECDKCAATFISEWQLKRHAKIHNGAIKPRFCLVCNRAFRGSTDLKVHMRTHTGEKPFKCETCGKPFSDRSALRRHTMTHTGERPRPCPYCPRAFRQTAPLIIHMRQRHNINIRHRCDVCYMSFCEDEPYILHMNNVHHKTVTLDDLKKEDAEGSNGMDMQQRDNDHSVTDQVSGNGHTIVEEMMDNEDVKQTMVDNEQMMQHVVDENKSEENGEQVAAERSLEHTYMTDSGENEQGGAITITAVAGGQDGQEIVLPADLVVAHQLIAVQQSNVDV